MLPASHRTQGQGLVEYALILALVVLVVIVILTILGPAIAQRIFEYHPKYIAARSKKPSPQRDGFSLTK
jgi:pilus assembly protein Flp/PilA